MFGWDDEEMEESAVPDDPKRWGLEIAKDRFDKLKTEERFWQLVALSRAVNALRFIHSALLANEHDDNSLRSIRTSHNSFFFNCALLYEALMLVERLVKNFRDVPEFAALREILKGRTATELRNSNLSTLRNQLTFHFFESEIGAQLVRADMLPRFVSGQGKKNADVYYELADLCTFWAFSGLQLDQAGALDQLGKQ